MVRLIAKIQDFLRLESAAGYVLMAAAALALLAVNSPLQPLYDAFLGTRAAVEIGAFSISKPLVLWINDGLMAIFFFLVGLEIKREILEGELSSPAKAVLPLFAAIGGMAVPAAIFFAFNSGSAETIRGWAIPTATDIAFALGVLTLFGPRVPIALKVFLLALAIIDDLGAVMVIALFYAGELSIKALALAGLGLAGLFALNLSGVRRVTPYALLGLFMWACVLKSGVHATLAGVLTALALPLRPGKTDEPAPLHRAEHGLHPWVAFLVLPLFAFANAGVSFAGLEPADFLSPLPLGVAIGLFIGKQIGVFGATFLAVKTGLARLPDGIDFRQIYGVALIAGVGFTMSLFIGSLAFSTPEDINAVRLGVLVGSLASALVGLAILNLVLPRAAAAPAPDAPARAH